MGNRGLNRVLSPFIDPFREVRQMKFLNFWVVMILILITILFTLSYVIYQLVFTINQLNYIVISFY